MGKGMDLAVWREEGVSEGACIVTVCPEYHHYDVSVCVWIKKPNSHFCWVRFPGHREKTTFFLQRGRRMTVQEDPSLCGGPDH